MSKLVTLKLEGDLEQTGFQATLEIGLEGEQPAVEALGSLPPDPELLRALQAWQKSYHRLNGPTRIKPKEIVYLGSIQPLETCQKQARILRLRLQHWVASGPFRNIDQVLREELLREDTVRVLIRTTNAHLHQLPWHLWDVVDRYPKTEVALSPPTFERRENLVLHRPTTAVVKILAILGHSAGIDIATDRQILEALPQAAVTFLVEPQRQQVSDQLWEAHWDILFFAGHSETLETTGRIYLNPHESLSLEELKYGLRRSIAQGLQLAIFNSCEGLGLAYALKELNLPHMIVMREPVPDRIAQAFLRYFLQAYAAGSSLYLAERQARERLQGLEGKFPCASWLPIIFQTTPAEPPTWQQLQQPQAIQPRRLETAPLRLPVIAFIILTIAALISVCLWLGLLQPLELKALDWLMGQRPTETLPERVLVIEVTEADINQYGYPLPDTILAQAIQKLQRYQPRVIGLDVFRDRLDPASQQLSQLLSQTDNLIALCSVRISDSPNKPGIAAPPNVPEKRLGFSNVVVDPDGVLRRQLLFMQPSPDSACATRFALSTVVAFQYLKKEGICPKNVADQRLQLGRATFKSLESNTGPYHNADQRGFQILLNYARPSFVTRSISLSALLEGQVNLENLKNQAVLLGVTAPISNPTDYFLTPLGTGKWPQQKMAGVFLHAEMTQHLIAAALDRRPVLTTLPEGGEGVWLMGWVLIGGSIGWKFSRLKVWSLSLGAAAVLLYGVCLGLLVQGLWVPLVPAALGLVASSSSLLLYRVRRNRPV